MKKLLTIILALFLGATASAMTLDTAEAAAEAPAAVLAAETESNAGKPGYNLWTGTTEAYTFDGNLVLSNNSTEGDINVDWNQANVYVDTTVESGNPVMRMATTRAHFSVNSPFSIEGSRPVTLSYRFKFNYSDPIYMSFRANNCGHWTGSTYNWESSAYQVNLSNGHDTGWTSQSTTFKAGDAVKKSVETVPETVTRFWFNFASQNYTSPCYIDDVSITPHYKITYDLCGGEGTTPENEYFLADSYTLQADTSTIKAPGGVAEFSHWVDQFGREIVSTVTPVLGEDLTLTAVYVSDYKKNKPGINLWTGTTEAYTFDGELTLTDNASGDINKDWADAADVNITDDNGNKVMHLKGNRTRFSVNADFSIDATRPVTLIYNFKTAATSEMWMTVRTNKSGYWKTSPSTFFVWESNAYKVDLSRGDTGNWTYQEKTFLPKDGINPTYDTVPEKAERFWFQLATAYTTPVYIDDVSFIPNYKITYDIGEGTGETPADEYFLADEYTLKADLTKITAPSGKVFAYWVDQNGNKFTDKVTPTVGEDMALTAIYEKASNSVKTLDIASMRYTGKKGIRIAGFVYDYITDSAEEYGFIATTAAKLGDADASSLTFDNSEIAYVSAANYIKGTDTSIIYCDDKEEAKSLFGDKAIDADGIYFTGVYVGVPETADAYTMKITGRSYIKIGGKYYYGTPVTKSVYDIAVAIKAKCEAEGTAIPAEVTKVIGIVEGN